LGFGCVGAVGPLPHPHGWVFFVVVFFGVFFFVWCGGCVLVVLGFVFFFFFFSFFLFCGALFSDGRQSFVRKPLLIGSDKSLGSATRGDLSNPLSPPLLFVFLST